MTHFMQNWTDRVPKFIKKFAVAVIYLAAWQGLSGIVGKALLLPGPFETVMRLFALLRQSETWIAAGATLLRVLAGYALGVIGGTALAALTARSRILDAVLRPLRGIVKATPVTSFILLALFWLSSGLVPVCISFLMVLPIVWMNLHEALAGVDPQLLEMAAAFHLPWRTRFSRITVPSVKPQFLAACTTSLGFAWKSGVAAEIIALPKRSVGSALYLSKLTLETADLFAWTLLVILLSMLLEGLLVFLLGRIRNDRA